jgi:pimeloyl-ACP methyl ester carboxylesterase
MNKKFLKALKVITITLVAIYIGICTLLYVKQDSLLFHPQPSNRQELAEILSENPGFDTVAFVMSDGNRTYGFVSKDTASTKRPLVLYFGGNAEEVSHLAEKKNYFPGSKLVLVNYRSFGLSQGAISEKTMFSDALEIYDQLAADPKIDPSHIIVIGRSIGTGVATYLSSQRKTSGTVLITPYESMIAVASEKYPFVPIALLIKHPFKSKTYAAAISSPMLSLISKNDQVIPPVHAYNLVKAWKGKTAVLEVNEDHNSIMDNEEVWKTIQGFVTENSQ